MQRWGVSESRLPPGSEILFREPTAWEKYRWQIVLTAIVLLSQTALIVGLLYEHRRRRTAELEVRQRMSELAHVNRQATVGELSASMAHELNQPLGAILSNAEAAELLLGSPSPDLVEVRKIVSDIRRNDQRASQIIQRLRGLLKKETVESKSIDLNETVAEVLEFLTAQASANDIRLKKAMAPQSLRVSGDRIQLQQAVLNLIVNGMEALAGTRNAERVITIRTALADNTSAEVSITDSGAGIPPEKLKDLFEPFFTTKENGMGMGLAIARKIIEAHGGHIWGENRSAGGAVFRLSLPLAPRPH
jgi:C4-dicarboxylate-specific signal transduction histidine kinase